MNDDKFWCLVGLALVIFDICLCGGIQYLQNKQNKSLPPRVQTTQNKQKSLPSSDLVKLLTVAPPEPVNIRDLKLTQMGSTGMSNTIYFTFLLKVGENYVEHTVDAKGNRIGRRLLGPDFKPIDNTEVAPATSESQSLPNH